MWSLGGQFLDITARAEETLHCSICILYCMIHRKDPFMLLLDYYGYFLSAGLAVEGICLFIEWLGS